MAIGRDDHEAALARADALADRVEELERELEAVKHPKPPEKPPRPKQPVGVLAAVVGGALLIGFFGYFVVRTERTERSKTDAREAHRLAVAARADAKTEWGALLRVEPCVREAAYNLARFTHEMPATWSAETIRDFGDTKRWLSGNCTSAVRQLVQLGRVSNKARAALEKFLAADAALTKPSQDLDTYLGARDWEEDHFTGAERLAEQLRPLLAAKQAAIVEARRVALPELRERIALLRDRHEKQRGRDELWWRIDLGLAWWAMNERALEASGVLDGRPADKAAAAEAVRPRLVQFRELASEAPIEVRRDLRKVAYLVDPLLAGEPFRTDGLWAFSHDDADLLRHLYAQDPPAFPPEPPPPPPRDD
jgi:hypothetical protein